MGRPTGGHQLSASVLVALECRPQRLPRLLDQRDKRSYRRIARGLVACVDQIGDGVGNRRGRICYLIRHLRRGLGASTVVQFGARVPGKAREQMCTTVHKSDVELRFRECAAYVSLNTDGFISHR